MDESLRIVVYLFQNLPSEVQMANLQNISANDFAMQRGLIWEFVEGCINIL
jgi:hypothetical protein